jgi:hypothetical protein
MCHGELCPWQEKAKLFAPSVRIDAVVQASHAQRPSFSRSRVRHAAILQMFDGAHAAAMFDGRPDFVVRAEGLRGHAVV